MMEWDVKPLLAPVRKFSIVCILYIYSGVPADFTLNVVIDNHPVSFFVHKRPPVDYFLETVSKWFDLVVFTASMEVYGKGTLVTVIC